MAAWRLEGFREWLETLLGPLLVYDVAEGEPDPPPSPSAPQDRAPRAPRPPDPPAETAIPDWWDEAPSWTPADLERVMAQPLSYDADTIAMERIPMPEIQFTNRHQPGLDPAAVYGRGALVAPVADLWAVRSIHDIVFIKGLPGIQTSAPRSSLMRVWPQCSGRPNVVTGLLPEALTGLRVGLPEPGD